MVRTARASAVGWRTSRPAKLHRAIARAAEGAPGLPPSPGQEAPPLLPTTPCFPGVPNAACSVAPALTSWASGGSGSGDVEGCGVGGVQQGGCGAHGRLGGWAAGRPLEQSLAECPQGPRRVFALGFG